MSLYRATNGVIGHFWLTDSNRQGTIPTKIMANEFFLSLSEEPLTNLDFEGGFAILLSLRFGRLCWFPHQAFFNIELVD